MFYYHSNSQITDGEVALAGNMSAGVYLSAWELGDPEASPASVLEYNYPSDMISPTSNTYPPFMSIMAPKDVAKVK